MAIIKEIKKQLASSQKLEVLRAIEKSDNVSQACLQHEVSRASYYAWLRKHKENPHAGLTAKKRVPNNPNKTPHDVATRVLDLAIRNPDSGCSKIGELLLKEGFSLSPPTVQKILNKNGLGTVSKRLFRLEKHQVLDGWQATQRQLELIHRNDPCLKECQNTGTYPGEIWVQDCFPIFHLIPGCYIYVVIDTYSSTTLVYPCFEKSSFIAADVLDVLALRRFRYQKFPIRKVLTSNAYIYSRHGKKYSDLCMSRNVLHEIHTGNSKNWNGYIERFKKAFLNSYRYLKTEKLDAAELADIFRIMKHTFRYDRTRFQGFPNFGMTPKERIDQFRAAMANATQEA